MKILYTIALAVIALGLCSCSEWTEIRSLDIETTTVDACVLEDYYAAVKAYKASSHKVVFLGFDNQADEPSSQAQRLSVLPDSADFIVLKNPDVLSQTNIDEMVSIREKGTKTLYTIDYAEIEEAWDAEMDADPSLTDADCLNFITEKTGEKLELYSRYGFDGVIFAYSGRSLVSLAGADSLAYCTRQETYFAALSSWRSSNASAVLAFLGQPLFLLESSLPLLDFCDYVILPTETASNSGDYSVEALYAIQGGANGDNLVISTTTIYTDAAKVQYGYFSTIGPDGNYVESITGAAQWCVAWSDKYTRAGIYVLEAQLNYYDTNPVYGTIRAAISLMNPSPTN